MEPEHNDPILDACLDEVLGGRTPPDMTARIVNAARNFELTDSAIPEPPPIMTRPPAIGTLPVDVSFATTVNHHKSSERRSERWSPAALVGLAAGLIGVLVVLGIAIQSQSARPQLANDQTPPRVDVPLVQPELRRQPADNSLAQEPAAPDITHEIKPTLPESPPLVAVLPTPEIPPPAPSVAPPVIAPPAPIAQAKPLNRNRLADAANVSFINNQFTQSWKEVGVRPTPAVSDAEWCQRLFTRVLGRSPTAEELKSLADDRSSNRREKLVRRILSDKAYASEFADHWAAILTQALIGRGPTPPNSLASRDDLQKFFNDALATNKPYSEIATSLLTANGSPRPGSDDYNPAVNFLLHGMTADATAPTSRVARVLLGHQLQCAQCHDHPTLGWTQDQFWGLNAGIRLARIVRNGDAVKLTNASESDLAVKFLTPNGQDRTVSPRFIDGTELSSGETASTSAIREKLARHIVNSDDFCRATASRVWAQLFDYGFTRPLDDFGPNATSEQSEVVDRMAGQFAAHDFDLKDLIRWSVLSEPFARSSKLTDLASKDMPEEGEPALFSRFYSRPARSADAAALAFQAARIRAAGSNEREMERARIDWLAQANRSSAKLPSKQGPSKSPSIVVNASEAVHRAVTGDPTGLVKRVAASPMDFDKKVEHLVLAALGRQPTPRERRAAGELLRTASNNQSLALGDLWWSLQNSSDGILDR
jgi:hypothetical protein